MPKSHLIVLMLALIVGSACTPNRLKNALTSEGAAQTSEISLPAPTPDGRNLQPQLGDANIDLNEVVTLLPPDAIPAILPDDVPQIMITADEADAAGMAPSVRVLGLNLNGDSRAYPIPYMSAHEIVNDEVGGRLIAATW